MTSAIDGIRAAEKLIETFSLPQYNNRLEDQGGMTYGKNCKDAALRCKMKIQKHWAMSQVWMRYIVNVVIKSAIMDK